MVIDWSQLAGGCVFWVALATTATAAIQSGGLTAETSIAAVYSRDVNGTTSLSERTVSHHSQTDDGDQMVIETYSPSIEATHLALTRRVRRTTTVTSDATQIVEDTEERNPAAPAEPLRMVRRSVTTSHRRGTDPDVRERQVFERDVNGRFVLILTETDARAGTAASSSR